EPLGADNCRCVRLVDRVSAASVEQQPVLLRVDLLRAVGAEPDHGRPRDVARGDIRMMRGRQIEAVTGEHDAVDGEAPLRPRKAREGDAVAVGERAYIAPDLYR